VLGKNLDERYGEAIERYLDATKNATAGSVRSRIVFSRSSPKIAVEIPEDLFQRADKAPNARASGARSCTPTRWPNTLQRLRPPKPPWTGGTTYRAGHGARRNQPERVSDDSRMTVPTCEDAPHCDGRVSV
jgi:hypothetical protein